MKGKWTLVGSLVAVLLLVLSVGLSRAQGPEPPEAGRADGAGPEAAVDNVIPIQGYLTDSAGNPLNGDYSITASIYGVSSGGTALCTDTETVAVNNGLFTINVDNCTSEKVDGRQLYLGIRVGTDAEMTPRRPIYPVPYAMSLMPGARISYTPFPWTGNYVDLEGNLGSNISWRLGYSYYALLPSGRANIGVDAEASGGNRACGVQGYAETSADNSEAYGVYGSADATGTDATAYGVYGSSENGVGVKAQSENSLALEAYSFNNVNAPAIFGCAAAQASLCDPYLDSESAGVIGVSARSGVIGRSLGDTYAGVRGLSGYHGVYGTSLGTYSAIYGVNGNCTVHYNAWRTGVEGCGDNIGVHGFTNSANGWAGVFGTDYGNGVQISTPGGKTGLSVSGGTKNAVVRTDDGSRLLYTEESTEVWFTDYGFGKLQNGVAVITIDPLFVQTVNLQEPYHVFVQPYGDASLYVTNRTPTGFEVRLHDGDPNVEFSYRIVAKRLGYENARLERAPWADNDPNLDPEKRAMWEAQEGGAP